MEPRPAQMLISTRWTATTAVVGLNGDLDLHAVPQLVAVLAEVFDRSPTAVDVDADGIDFIDSSGLNALLTAQREARATGAPLRVTRSSESLDRILTMTGLHDLLTGPTT